MKNNKKGFTLIELLVVIAIIGLLSTLAVVSLKNARTKARDARRQSDLKQISTAMELYMSQNDTYPIAGTCGDPGIIAAASGGALCGTGNAITDGTNNFLTSIPVDPTNVSPQRYDYVAGATPAQGYCFQVNLEGTADTAADDWFICENGSCHGSPTDCAGGNQFFQIYRKNCPYFITGNFFICEQKANII